MHKPPGSHETRGAGDPRCSGRPGLMRHSIGSRLNSAVGQPRPGRAKIGGYLLFTLVLAGLSALLIWGVVPEVLDGQLIETDNYMRLVRVTHLVETRDWYDHSIPRSNAPYGEVLHWTRPLDMILLGTTAPLLAFFHFPQALHLAAVFLPPLILLFTCFAVAWAATPLAGERFRFYAMITVLAQLGVVGYSLPGRIDHHGLFILLFALTCGLAVRWILTPHSRWLAVSTGAVLGLGLWVGPEFLLPMALVLVTGAVIWIVDGADNARKNLWLAVGLLAVVTVAWLLEHPPARLFVEEYDRISAPHVLLSALVLTFWMIIVRIEGAEELKAVRRQGVWTRSSRTILGAGAGLATLFLIYPSFFQGPTADIDPRIWGIWLDLIEERQAWMPPASVVDAGNLIAHLGAAAFCIPFVGWVLVRERRTPDWWVWAFVALLLVVFTGLALFMVRHVPYAEILLVLGTVTLLSRILPQLNSLHNLQLRAAARAGIAALLITGPLFLGLALTAHGGQTGREVRDVSRMMADRCPLSTFVSFLVSEDGMGEQPRTIAAHLDYGPEILYRTPHRVLGTPYHRNSEGILVGFAVLGGTDLEHTRDLVLARGVDLILVCPLHAWLYGAESGEQRQDPSLHDLLLSNREPDWLEMIPIPRRVAGEFRLFRVTLSQWDDPHSSYASTRSSPSSGRPGSRP